MVRPVMSVVDPALGHRRHQLGGHLLVCRCLGPLCYDHGSELLLLSVFDIY